VLDRSNEWVSGTPLKDTVVVNVGDCLNQWTNELLKSNVHRVVPKVYTGPDGHLWTQERFSIACFIDPDKEAMIECLPSVLKEGEAAKHKPVRFADWLQYKLSRTY